MKTKIASAMTLLSLLGLLACPGVMIGCEQEGPMEQTGEEMDEFGENVEDTTEDIGG